MNFLRQNTAVVVTVGPFYDKTDGVTIETALTITNERITLIADTDDNVHPVVILDNLTAAASGGSNDLNYVQVPGSPSANNSAGLMRLELTAANTNRVGRMTLSITDAANHVPVFHTYFVLPQAIYDWLTGVIIPLPANVTTWNGTTVATPATAGIPDVNVKNIDNDAASASGTVTFPNATLASTTNITAGTITTATNVTTVNGLAANVITAAATAADFGAEVADAVWDEDATGHQTQGTFGQAIGDPVADTGTIYKAVVTDATGATVGVDVVDLKTQIGTAGAGLTAIDLPNQTMDITGNITGNISGSIGSLAAQAKADVNAEVVDALATDTYAEPAQGAPAATTTLAAKINYLYKNWRNKKTQTATTFSLFNDDAATVDHKSTVSDDATTATRGEMATGP